MSTAKLEKHYLLIVFILTLILLIGIADHLVDFLYIGFLIFSYIRFEKCRKNKKRWVFEVNPI